MAVSADLLKFYDRVSPAFTEMCVKQAMGCMVPDGEDFTSWVRLLHVGAVRAVMVNGVLSEWFDLLSGLAQGSPLSCLLSSLVEQAKATLLAYTEEEWSALRAANRHIPELQRLCAVVGLALPGGRRAVEVRFADDLYAFLARSAENLRMFFAICDFCG